MVTCNYVLNVIEDPQERLEVIEKMKALGDEVYITVRADMKCIKDTTPMKRIKIIVKMVSIIVVFLFVSFF